ncbi:MAG TPA: metallopeptidase TldD-related protein, partial [Stellaceae bacterium]|nr:metallopeptidase TldD-related protein [Stellaceae bacterium]
RIFPEAITITEDPHRQRGPRSKPFDAEGLPNRRRALIDRGVLTTWLLDLRSARQLGLKSTGHAARGTASPPSPSATNIWIEPGMQTPAELMADIKSGFYVTELMGMGVNGITGDYSRGAAGFWIENGAIAFPVSEMTVAGNLNDMFLRIVAANDLEFRVGADAPTLRIDDLTVAGA